MAVSTTLAKDQAKASFRRAAADGTATCADGRDAANPTTTADGTAEAGMRDEGIPITLSTTCGMCQGGCQVLATIQDGRLMSVKPDKSSPKGRLCSRGALAPSSLYGSERLKHPLLREGARGQGELREASWDEALDRAAELIRGVVEEHGARAMASYFGRGVLGMPISRLGMGPDTPLARLGSPNDMGCGSICNLSSSMVTPVTVMGIGTRSMVQDVEHSDLIVAWGKNSSTDDGPQTMLKRIKKAQERGATLIVVDPRRTGLGEIADWWIPVTPGTDGALALGMLKLIIEEGRYDRNFVRDFTRGFDEFAAYLEGLSLAGLCAQCGVPEADLRRFVELFCSTTRASLVSYTGLEYQASAVQNGRAIYTLWTITGKLDAEGGIYLNVKGAKTQTMRPVPAENAPIGAAEYPLFYGFCGQGQFSNFPKAVLKEEPYPARGLLVIGGSPMLSFPETRTWRRAYEALDCLIVVDRFLTEEARYADVVLPACSIYESPRSVPGLEGPRIEEPLVSPVGESRDDVLIVSGIAERLGVGEGLPQDGEQYREWLLAGTAPFAGDFAVHGGLDERHFRKYESGELRADGRPGFPTPSGKFEICSCILEDYGFTPYPEYRDIREIPVMDDPGFTFTMTTGARSNNRMGVLGANLEGIAAIEPAPLADIDPADAQELGIAEGEGLRVTTPFGSGVFIAHLCGMARRSIHLPHGGGSSRMPKAWREGNVNELCSLDHRDPLTGFVTFKSVPCRVEKA